MKVKGRLKLIKKIIETVLLFFAGVLVRVSLSMQLDFFDNFLLFIGAILIVSYIVINEIMAADT